MQAPVFSTADTPDCIGEHIPLRDTITIQNNLPSRIISIPARTEAQQSTIVAPEVQQRTFSNTSNPTRVANMTSFFSSPNNSSIISIQLIQTEKAFSSIIFCLNSVHTRRNVVFSRYIRQIQVNAVVFKLFV